MSTDKKSQENATAQQASRRKIVKGLAGLPAMVTLASGAASAATSSQCIVNNVTNPDIDINSKVVLNTPAAPGTPILDCVDPTGLTPMGPPGGEVVYESGLGEPMRQIYTAADPASLIDGEADGQACVVFVNGDGEIEGFDSTAANVNATTTSCYTSFAVAGP